MNLSIVIPSRNDPWLSRTICNIRKECVGDPEIIVVQDGGFPDSSIQKDVIQVCPNKPLGSSAARDYGIQRASNNNILTIDAHMDFTGQQNALRNIETELSINHTHILCCRMGALKAGENEKIDSSTRFAHGAIIVPERVGSSGEQIALKAVWHKCKKKEIPSVMGACYAFRRDWYITGLQSPWSLGLGYGMDEETLSIANWICGGISRSIDVFVGHIFLTGQHFEKSPDYIADVWVNRIRLVQMLPMSDRLRARLLKWIYGNNIECFLPAINARLLSIDAKIKKTISHLSSYGRTVNDFIDNYLTESVDF